MIQVCGQSETSLRSEAWTEVAELVAKSGPAVSVGSRKTSFANEPARNDVFKWSRCCIKPFLVTTRQPTKTPHTASVMYSHNTCESSKMPPNQHGNGASPLGLVRRVDVIDYINVLMQIFCRDSIDSKKQYGSIESQSALYGLPRAAKKNKKKNLHTVF